MRIKFHFIDTGRKPTIVKVSHMITLVSMWLQN